MNKLLPVLVLFLPLSLRAACTVSGSTLTAASPSESDVNACVSIAANGDTVVIPSGSSTWSIGITVPSGIGITIMGTGTPNAGASTTGANSSCTATSITDDLASGSMFVMEPSESSSLSRISCMEILAESGLGANAIASPIEIGGTCNSSGCPNIRLDNVTFDSSLQGTISDSDTNIVVDDVFGVMDHNTMTNGSFSSQLWEFVNFNDSAWLGVGSNGDNSWASPDSFGTAQTLYLENNYFGQAVIPTESEAAAPTGEGGGRIALRFNTLDGADEGAVNHGTESNGRPRGGRQLEFYANNFTCTNTAAGCQGGVAIRSGVALMFGNTMTAATGSWFNQYMAFSDYRILQPFEMWGVCDGTGPYDDNDGTVYASGTIGSISTSGVSATITDASKSWTSGQWVPAGVPYAIHDLTTNTGAQITANGTNTASANGWTGPPNFNAGDSYEILRATVCIDQPNRSGGTLLSGATPSPTGWVGEALDPSYEWDDSGHAPNFGIVQGTGQMLANRDWYTDNTNNPEAQTSPTSPFNGTSGVGFGTVANRPTSCTPRVAYWATDQGSWNQSGASYAGGYTQGELFICTANNTWTASYIPYVYPHPLDSSGSMPTGSFSPSTFAYGNQNVSTTSSAQNTTLTNTGTTSFIPSLSVTGTNSGDFAISSNSCTSSLTLNSTCNASVTFTPSAAGLRTALLTDATSGAAVSLSGTGVASGSVSFSPTSISFGNQTVGTTSAQQNSTLSNTTSSPVQVSLSIGGTNASYFSIASTTCPTPPATLAASGSCTASITFTPLTAITASATLTESNSGATVSLTGTGASTVSFSPSTLTFPGYSVGVASLTQQTTLTNANGSSVTVNPSISGTDASSFGQTNNCGTTLAANTRCTFTVTMTPSATGGLSATLNGGGVTAGLGGIGIACSNTAVGQYTLCGEAYNDQDQTTVTTAYSPGAGNAVIVDGAWCFNSGCNGYPPTGFTATISDNINSPEAACYASPGSPYLTNGNGGTNVWPSGGTGDFEGHQIWFCPAIPPGVTSFTMATAGGTATATSLQVSDWKPNELSSSCLPLTSCFESVANTGALGSIITSSTYTATLSTSAATAYPNDLIFASFESPCCNYTGTAATGYTGITVAPSGTPDFVVEASGTNTPGQVQTATANYSGTSSNTWWFGVIAPIRAYGSSVPVTLELNSGATISGGTIQ